MTTFTLTKPDDWHLHVRDGDYLKTTVPAAAQQFARAIIMPNLKPPITSVLQAKSYHQRIITAIPKGVNFQPLMTFYLTPDITPALVSEAKESQMIVGFKLYPAGVTTNSQSGVSEFSQIYPVLASLEENDLPLLIHAESPDIAMDIFEREQAFLENIMPDFIKRFPKLRMIIEHVSSEFGINWVISAPNTIAATITPHHLLLNRNDVLSSGIKPHHYCLPIVKTLNDQEALINAAISGNPKFFLGTDSAPHAKSQKESGCGPAGIFMGNAALSLYIELFEKRNALDKFESFASFHGADFYGLPRNTDSITLIKKPWKVPLEFPFGNDVVVPLFAGKELQWQIKT